MNFISRFAPSPTGYLHVGNVRTALINWLYIRKNNGKFILRVDDTDKIRSKNEYIEQIRSDLKWLGINWDESFLQSSRYSQYENAKNKLISDGRLYPCYETTEELDLKRRTLISRGLPPIYDRYALNLNTQQKNDLEQQGRKPHYRFKLNKDEIIKWNDMIRGEIIFNASNLSDPILIREDGSMTYMLCSVLDDIDYNITHVMRGEDHISNTAISIQLINALGGDIPCFAHLSLLKGKDKQISKRLGGFDIKTIREDFIEPMAVNSFLSKIGSSKSISLHKNISELINSFDIKDYGKAPACYEYNDLKNINKKLIGNLDFEDISYHLDEISLNIDKDFWNAVKHNINNIMEIKVWSEICIGKIQPIISPDDKEFLIECSRILPKSPWNNNTWSMWLKKIKQQTGRKGKKLFLPIRKALSAREDGPELSILLPLIGEEKAFNRLNGKTI